MNTSYGLKALAVWAAIVPLAILNGMFREGLLSPLFGDRAALVLSGILLSLLVLGLTWIAFPWLGPVDARRCHLTGACWLALTVTFEFGLGLLFAGKSWSELLAAYDISSGNLWTLVLAVTALAPWLAAKMRGKL